MISNPELRREARDLLRHAQVSLPAFAGFSLLVSAAPSVLDALCSGSTYEELMAAGPVGTFVYILVLLISLLLEAGRVEYCGAAIRGERAEYGDLFCGFSYVFRFLGVLLAQALLVGTGFLFFFIPGILLLYRYRFALYVLCEDPTQGITAILRRSAAELNGFRWQLFRLDLSFLPYALLCLVPALLWDYAAAEHFAALPAPVSALIGTAVTFPTLLLTFWRTAAELVLRRRILEGRPAAQSPELP